MILRKSFTLFELILTIVVISIIGIPLGLLISTHIESVLYNEGVVFAMHLGRYELERIVLMDFENISTAFFSQYQGYPYDLERTVTYEAGSQRSAESLKRIQLQVFRAGQTIPLIKLVTFRARNVSF